MPRKHKGRSTACPTDPSSEHCLCLICRQAGHVVQSCPHFQRWERNGIKIPFLSGPTHSSPPIDNSSQTLCQQCMQRGIGLDSLSDAHPFVLDDKMPVNITRANRKMTQIPPLGPVKTISLLSTCPLCRLIFDITYLTEDDIQSITKPRGSSDGQLALLPAWTIHRLERDLDWAEYQFGKGPYAKIVYTSVTSKNADDRTPLVDSVVDAIGLVDDEGEGGAVDVPALRVRQLDPRTPNYSIIKEWFRRCEESHHITCRLSTSEDLRKIKLVDVKTRQILMYPPEGCDYIALSYVWGGVQQASYKLGDVLPTVLATLEDAMLVTSYLGKRYLWADSLCIEQENHSDKAAQIPLMSAIYTGAWATIFNIAGQSANSGLPRVSTLEEVIPQMSCNVDGKRLLTVMPTLPQQISRSVWATRAWTFQEGLLSPRRLFFTNHQVYFECNSVQCCESLDDSTSPFHTPSDEQRQALLDESACAARDLLRTRGSESVLGQGVLRDPFRPFRVPKEPDAEDIFRNYLNLVHTYTAKKLTQDTDSINAFSAMLTRLTEINYKQGFLHGLPVEEMPRALLWVHSTKPRRRVDFPAWSWAGWEGVVRAVVVKGAKGDPALKKGIRPPLRIWKADQDGRPELVYGFNPVTDGSDIEEDESSEESQESEEDEEDEDSEEGEEGEEDENPPDSDEADDSKDDANAWETDSASNSPDAPEDQDSDPCTGWFPKTGPDFDKKVVDSFWDGYNAWVNSQRQSDRRGKTGGNTPESDDKSEEGSERDPDPDPIELLAKQMAEAPSVTEHNLGSNELLIEGITVKLTFRKDRQKWDDASDTEDTPDGIHSERCIVKLDSVSERQQLRVYGHDAAKLVNERGRREQEFLILSRELDLDMDTNVCEWCALLWIDREGDRARRVGVASLRLRDDEDDDRELLAFAKPERRSFTLK